MSRKDANKTAALAAMLINPAPVSSFSELVQRASLGPIPGELMLLAGILFSGGWIAFATITLFLDRAKHGPGPRVTMG
jgi:hypothetical protein